MLLLWNQVGCSKDTSVICVSWLFLVNEVVELSPFPYKIFEGVSRVISHVPSICSCTCTLFSLKKYHAALCWCLITVIPLTSLPAFLIFRKKCLDILVFSFVVINDFLSNVLRLGRYVYSMVHWGHPWLFFTFIDVLWYCIFNSSTIFDCPAQSGSLPWCRWWKGHWWFNKIGLSPAHESNSSEKL